MNITTALECFHLWLCDLTLRVSWSWYLSEWNTQLFTVTRGRQRRVNGVQQCSQIKTFLMTWKKNELGNAQVFHHSPQIRCFWYLSVGEIFSYLSSTRFCQGSGLWGCSQEAIRHFLWFSGLSGGVASDVPEPVEDCRFVLLRGLLGLMPEDVDELVEADDRSVWVLIPWTSLEGALSSPTRKG